jgi:Tfp pilus assembly protein PilX
MKHKKKGVILVVSLILIIVFGAFGLGMFFFADNENTASVNYQSEVQTFHAAETGVENAYLWLQAEHNAGRTPLQASSPQSGFNIVVDGFAENIALGDDMNLTNPTDLAFYNQFNYSYYIEPFTVIGTGIGSEIGLGNQATQNGYNYYKITAFGFGPNQSQTRLEAVVLFIL